MRRAALSQNPFEDLRRDFRGVGQDHLFGSVLTGARKIAIAQTMGRIDDLQPIDMAGIEQVEPVRKDSPNLFMIWQRELDDVIEATEQSLSLIHI